MSERSCFPQGGGGASALGEVSDECCSLGRGDQGRGAETRRQVVAVDALLTSGASRSAALVWQSQGSPSDGSPS